MTIIKVLNGVLVHNGDYIFTMEYTTLFTLGRDNVPAYHITIFHEYGGKIEDMFFSDCSAKTAWYNFYRMARRKVWYINGR